MNASQKTALRRMTSTMWEVLRNYARMEEPLITPSWRNSARTLKRHGFLIVYERPDEYGNM
jgi:hypothetical protein